VRRTVAPIAVALTIAVGWVLLQRAGDARRVERAGRPQIDGRLQARGLEAPIWILRDERGVPHVEAEHESDAYFGLGFVHAQDRLGQMLSLWLSARGRTAEVIGAPGLAADRLARILGIGRLADRQADRLDAATHRLLRAYSAGVSSRLERVRAGLAAPPAQFRAEALPIERWSPADSVALLKAWSWGLGGTLETSLVLDDLLRQLGPGRARPFFPIGAGIPPMPGEPPRMAHAGARGPAPAAGFRDPLRRRLGLQASGVGSSAWVLSGAASASGHPLLAGDVHVETTVPAQFYQAHVSGGGLDVAGATLPGIPVFWSGASGRVAWAATAARASVIDLFVESLEPSGPIREPGPAPSVEPDASRGDPDAPRGEPGAPSAERAVPGRFHDGRRWRPLRVREEKIAVRGGPEQTLVVRATAHGPLVNPILPRTREPLALAWVGARPGDGIGPLLRAARAEDGAGFVAALAEHHEPALAFVWGDAGGRAGLQVAGWIPRRALPSGLVPVSGRSTWADWHHAVPAERLPALQIGPRRRFVVAADGPLEAGPDRRIEWLWRTGERSRRIEALLAAAIADGKVSLGRMARLQLDVASGGAGDLLEPALELAGAPAQLASEEREIVDLLRSWDRRSEADSVGAAVYHVFTVELARALFEPVLGPDLYRRWVGLVHTSPTRLVGRVLAGAASGREAPAEWTRGRMKQTVREVLRSTWLRFGVEFGPNREKWSWGRLHSLRFRPFGVLRWDRPKEAALGPHPYGGDRLSVSPGGYDWNDPFAVRTASTQRLAVDTAELDKLLVSLAPGQVEQPGRPHRADGVSAWLAGRPGLLVRSPVLLEDEAVARLRIEPEAER